MLRTYGNGAYHRHPVAVVRSGGGEDSLEMGSAGGSSVRSPRERVAGGSGRVGALRGFPRG